MGASSAPKSAKPVKHVKPVKPVKPVNTVKSVKPVKTVKTVKPVKKVKSVKSVKPVNTAKSVKEVKPVKPVNTVRHVKEVKPVKTEHSSNGGMFLRNNIHIINHQNEKFNREIKTIKDLFSLYIAIYSYQIFVGRPVEEQDISFKENTGNETYYYYMDGTYFSYVPKKVFYVSRRNSFIRKKSINLTSMGKIYKDYFDSFQNGRSKDARDNIPYSNISNSLDRLLQGLQDQNLHKSNSSFVYKRLKAFFRDVIQRLSWAPENIIDTSLNKHTVINRNSRLILLSTGVNRNIRNAMRRPYSMKEKVPAAVQAAQAVPPFKPLLPIQPKLAQNAASKPLPQPPSKPLPQPPIPARPSAQQQQQAAAQAEKVKQQHQQQQQQQAQQKQLSPKMPSEESLNILYAQKKFENIKKKMNCSNPRSAGESLKNLNVLKNKINLLPMHKEIVSSLYNKIDASMTECRKAIKFEWNANSPPATPRPATPRPAQQQHQQQQQTISLINDNLSFKENLESIENYLNHLVSINSTIEEIKNLENAFTSYSKKNIDDSNYQLYENLSNKFKKKINKSK